MTFEKLMNYSVGSVTVSKILWAVIIAVAALFVIKGIMRFVNRTISKTHIDKSLHGFIRSTIKVLLYFVAVLIVTSTLGINVTSLVAVLSVAGLAVSLAVQGALSNLAGGIMLLTSKPVRVGDYVEAGGVSGTVAEIGLIYTKLVTPDSKDIFIPNSDISANKIINYTATKTRRVDITVTASYDNSIEQVKGAINKAISRVDGINSMPAPFVAVNSYGDSSIEYVIRVWVDTPKFWDCHFALTEKLKEAFDEDKVEMTYNHLNIHMLDK